MAAWNDMTCFLSEKKRSTGGTRHYTHLVTITDTFTKKGNLQLEELKEEQTELVAGLPPEMFRGRAPS